jgi:hypothetical protein
MTENSEFLFPFLYPLSASIITMEKVRDGKPLNYLVAQIFPALVGHLKTSAYVHRYILGHAVEIKSLEDSISHLNDM